MRPVAGNEKYYLEANAKRSLECAIDTLGRGAPLPVVVVSHEYELLLKNWIAHISRLGITRFLIVAMDGDLEARLKGNGLVVARGNFDGTASDFWLRRMLIWRHLVAIGVDIIQSDVDALWFRDPVQALQNDQPFDLLCTQGTLHPISAVRRWGFVLCTGLMWLRASHESVQFLDSLARRGQQILDTDDQEVLNDLLADLGLAWATEPARAQAINFDGVSFDTYPQILWGLVPTLGLRVGMLPHGLFPRLPIEGTDAIVRHLLRPEHDNARIGELKAANCWLLDA